MRIVDEGKREKRQRRSFTDEFKAGRKIEYRSASSACDESRVDPYSVDEEDEIMDRLKGLGYIN